MGQIKNSGAKVWNIFQLSSLNSEASDILGAQDNLFVIHSVRIKLFFWVTSDWDMIVYACAPLIMLLSSLPFSCPTNNPLTGKT